MAASNKFAYVMRHSWPVKLLYGFAFLSWLGVIYGYVIFFSLNPWYWLLFGPVMAIFTAYYLLNYGINLFYRAFDVDAHAGLMRKYWRGRTELPTVDIFVPVCGEPVRMLEETFAAVKSINYPEKKVFILDDRGDADAKRLALKMGFAYLSRPNKGEMKKAGNLKFGHENSKGEFIVIFDADFAPHPDFIADLLPYMADPKVAIVQSPQHFSTDAEVHGRSALEYGAGHVQEDFYRIVQMSRDRFGAAICVGSNAVYRRSALNDIGGVPQIEHSEDVYVGFNLLSRGWKLKYVPLILAKGLCPSDVHSYFHQQHRWCSGSLSLCLSKAFFTARIGLAQRLCFLAGLLYYVTNALSLIMAFQVFVLLFWHFDVISMRTVTPFLPHLLFIFLLQPLSRISRHRYGTSLAKVTQAFSISHAMFAHFFARKLEWQASNTKKSKAASAFIDLVGFNAVYFLLYMACVAVAVGMGRFPVFKLSYYSVMFWVLYNLMTSFLFLFHGYKAWRKIQRMEMGQSHAIVASPVGLRLVGAAIAIGIMTPGIGAVYSHQHGSLSSNLGTPGKAIVLAAENGVAVTTVRQEGLADEGYSEVAAPGDSLTLLYRRIVSRHCQSAPAQLTSEERVFSETMLVAQDGRTVLRPGDSVSASSSRLVALFDESKALTDGQRAAWQKYAERVSFDGACAQKI